MKDNTVLIMNPTSKNGRGKQNWKYFEEFESIVSTSRENAIESVINSDKEIIVAVGGDGTINQCVNGIELQSAPPDPRAYKFLPFYIIDVIKSAKRFKV